jgi:predicted phage terminase large subunit-like protein
VIIADVRRGKWDTPTVTQMVKETANDDGGDVAVGIEQAHFALAVIQDLSRDKEFARFPLIKIPIAGRDKEQRSRGWRARLGNGEVYLVRGPWNEAYIDECLRFTNQKTDTDDQIDATSVAFEAVFKTMGGLREESMPAPPNSFAALGLQNYHETD